MKKKIFLVLAFCSVPLLAQPVGNPTDTPMMQDTVVIINNQTNHMITGFVTQYTNYDSMLVVKVLGREDTMKLTPMTSVTKKGKKIPFKNLEKDEQVSAWYMNVNGQNVANKVEVKPGKITKGAGTPDTGMMQK